MGTMLALFIFMTAGAICLVAVISIAAIAKFSLHLILLPIKLILLPFVAVAVVAKAAILLTLITLSLVVLIPLAIIIGLIAAPFALLGIALA